MATETKINRIVDELIANPAFQSGILPLLVALVSGLVLRPFGWFWAGLGFAIAYFCSVYLTVGFQLTPFTSTRKIILLGAIAVMLGMILDVAQAYRRYIPWFLILLAAAAVLWVLWPVLKRQEGNDYWLMLILPLAYTAWLTTGVERLRDKPMQASIVALALGLGSGISALLGASALLGQLGIAISAIAGAYILLMLIFKDLPLGSLFALPVGLLSSLIGVTAVVYASLPWYSLLSLIFIPIGVLIPVPTDSTKLKKIILLSLYTLPLAAISIAITWSVAGAPPL